MSLNYITADDVSRRKIPKILEDIAGWLKNYQIQISEAVEREGRGGSLKDEGSIKKLSGIHLIRIEFLM